MSTNSATLPENGSDSLFLKLPGSPVSFSGCKVKINVQPEPTTKYKVGQRKGQKAGIWVKITDGKGRMQSAHKDLLLGELKVFHAQLASVIENMERCLLNKEMA